MGMITIRGSPFNWMGKRQCRCVFDVKHHSGAFIMMQLQCVLPTGHPGLHMDQHGSRWWNRNAFMEDISRREDNQNAQSATGKRMIFIGPDRKVRG